ncbi:energy transducer TonB, partial [candidate division KSB1 bacterium]
GNIVETKVASSLGDKNGCDEAAVNAVKAVKWKPAIARNKPVKVWVAIPIQFTLR